MLCKKIVTHAGRFHGDDVLSVSLIKYFVGSQVELERTYTPSDLDFNDPQVWVVDIGRRFSIADCNFDHHQDSRLPASCLLVFDYLVSIADSLGNRGEVLKVVAPGLRMRLVEYVSNVDVGKIIEGRTDSAPTFTQIVRVMNAGGSPDAQFLRCLNIVDDILESFILDEYEYQLSYRTWDIEVVVTGMIALRVGDSVDDIRSWKDCASRDGVMFYIGKSARGGYRMETIDARLWPILKDEKQTFLHNSGFLAGYETVSDAMDAAKNLVIHYKED